MHCFSMPDRLDECLERGWWISFAGNVTYPKSTELAAAAERVPLDRLLVETDAPYLTPQAVRKHRNQSAYVVHTARFIAERRGHRLRGARAGGRGERRAPVRLVSGLPAQPSLRRLKAFGIRPNRELGQNFLIDSNLLDVIGREAALAAGRRRARGRRRPGRAVASTSASARRARPRRRGRPQARARPPRRPRPAPQRHAALRRRRPAGPRARSTRPRPRSSRTSPTASRRR